MFKFYVVFFLVVITVQFFVPSECYFLRKEYLKVAIIGAGPTGLISARYCLGEGFDCDVFEQTGKVGGTWVYVNETDFDENGIPVHSAMYKGLKTITPKEIMQSEGFPYPEEIQESFLDQSQVQEYYENFTKTFNIDKIIKFYRYVIQIEQLIDQKWYVLAYNAQTKSLEENVYDAVMICNGHYEKPSIPKYKGAYRFKGLQMHSHSYRIPEMFTGKRILLIGGGRSGTDIANHLYNSASKVILSHRSTLHYKINEGIVAKPAVKELFKNSVSFKDGTEEDVDVIIYCTGYLYSYPFLRRSSGVEVVRGRWVKPLFEQIVNIRNPTMGFIGVPYGAVMIVPMAEVQSKFFLANLRQQFGISSTMEMWKDLNNEMTEKIFKQEYPDQMHKVDDVQREKEYLDNLSTMANVTKIPNVLFKIHKEVIKSQDNDYCCRIINDEDFQITNC